MAWNRGQHLQGDRYIIDRVLGEGDFGITYLARNTMNDLVVIKTLNDIVQADFAKFQAFVGEMQRQRLYTHPNLVQIYDVFPEGQIWCIVMEYIEGETLASRVENQGAMPEMEALRYIQQDWLKLFSSRPGVSRSTDNKNNYVQPTSELEPLLEEEEEEDPEELLDVRPTKKTRKRYTQDSIRLYLQEISRIHLLGVEEEVEIARKIVDLMKLEQIRDRLFRQLKRQPEESEWALAVKMPLPEFRQRLNIGRQAKNKMVQSNLRLVVSIAKNYTNRGLSFQDLIQEGSLGLIRAAEKFDPEKGYKFSTYATWWIRQAVRQGISDQSRTIRLPVHLHETLSRIRKNIKILYQELGRKPTEEEIAILLEMTIEKLRFITKVAQPPISLEKPINNQEYWRMGKLIYFIESEDVTPEYFAYIEEEFKIGDFIETPNDTPEEYLNKKLLREDIESILSTINPREGEVLRLRYGLDDGFARTLEEIGQMFNITRERIRQIEAKALRKMRHPSRSNLLKEYF